MRRISILTVAAMAIAACGQSEEASIDEVGIWNVTGNGITATATYTDNGTYNIAPVVNGVPLPGFDSGTYEIEGNTLTYTSNEAAMGCEEGDEGRYEVQVDGSASWTLNLIEDHCDKRAEGGPFVHTPAA